MSDAATPSAESNERLLRYRKAAELLREWLSQDDCYDESTWPALDQELRSNPLRCTDTIGDGMP